MAEAIQLSLLVYGLSAVVAMLAAVLIKVLVVLVTAGPAEQSAAAGEIPQDELLAIIAAVHHVLPGYRIVSVEQGDRRTATDNVS